MVEETTLQNVPVANATDILVIIIYLVLIVLAAYFLTKFVARKAMQRGMRPRTGDKARKGSTAKKQSQQGYLVSVVDRIPVDRDKTMMVVEFSGKYYLMSTTAEKIECIDTVDIPVEEYEEVVEDDATTDEITAKETDEAKTYPPGEETFFKRFKKCMRIYFSAYLPKGKNKGNQNYATKSFDEQLKKEVTKQKKSDDVDQQVTTNTGKKNSSER